MNLTPRETRVLIGLGAALIVVVFLRLIVGEPIPRTATGAVDVMKWLEYFALRRDRVVIGLIVGSSLAVSGTALQSLLRNPLADPYILGVSSGAALGVMAALAGWLWFLGPVATPFAAFAGALTAMVVVYLLAQKRGHIDPVGLLLIGVIVNALNGAAIMFINYLNPVELRSDMSRWMMGYLDENTGWLTMVFIGVLVAGSIVLVVSRGKAMDVATFSDSEAKSLGLDLSRTRLLLFALAGLMTAGSVMLAGPIGFVGLICPHIVRLLVGPSNTTVILGGALAGSFVVIGADVAVKLASVGFGIGLMPIGVLTALIGGPMFLVLLRPRLGGM